MNPGKIVSNFTRGRKPRNPTPGAAFERGVASAAESGFFAGSDNSVHALVTIKDRSGRLVYQAEDTLPVEAHAVNYVIADIGPLEPGFYRVFSRTIQKEKTAKQRFWIQVTPQADALCVVPE